MAWNLIRSSWMGVVSCIHRDIGSLCVDYLKGTTDYDCTYGYPCVCRIHCVRLEADIRIDSRCHWCGDSLCFRCKILTGGLRLGRHGNPWESDHHVCHRWDGVHVCAGGE